jgi:hypothetical protein
MFIATNHALPLIDYSKAKYYKFKDGVKVEIDDDGNIYHYTNESDKNSPDLLISCSAEEADSIVVDSEEDFNEIQISIGYKDSDIQWYTNKNIIYTLNWGYSDKRANELIDYLKENMKEGYEVELWLTWMDECIEPDKYYCDIEDISIKDIKKVFDFSTFNKPQGIVIFKRSRHEL